MADQLPIFPINETLSIEISYEFSGNGTLIAGDGKEFRNAPHPHPLAQFAFSRELLNQQGNANVATLQVIRDFLDNLKGKSGRFRYRDQCDYQATAIPYTIHLNDAGNAIAASENSNPAIAQTQGILLPEADGIITEFQLCKQYQVIASNATSISTRPITRPTIGTREILTERKILTEENPIAIFQSGIEIKNYTVDETTGRVTFTAPPTGTLTVFDNGIETTDFTVISTIEAITFASFPTGALTFEEDGNAIAASDYEIDGNAVIFNPPLEGVLTVKENGNAIAGYSELTSPLIEFSVIPTGVVTVFEDGNELTVFDYDSVNGTITFGIIPVGTLTSDFFFDLPCQLAADTYNIEIINYDIAMDNWLQTLEQIEILEIRERSLVYPVPVFNDVLELKYPIDTTYNSQTGRESSTLETKSSSDFVISEAQYNDIIPRFNLGSQQNLLYKEKEFILCLWRCCLGTLGGFNKFEPSLLGNESNFTIETRFNDNRLSLEYLANNEEPFRLNAIAATGKPVLLNSILNAPETTKFYFIIDTTSLDSATVSKIQDAVNNLKPLLRDNVFGGSQSLVNSNVIVIESTDIYVGPGGGSITGERWMFWYNDQFEVDGYYVFFMDEAVSAYHENALTDIATAPTSDWNNDFGTFKSNFQSRNYFNSIVYQVEDSASVSFSQAFQKHITEAFFGTNGYESIEPYRIRVRVDVLTSDLTSENLFNDLLGEEPLGTNLEKEFFTTYTVARCVLIQRTDGVNIAVTNCSYPLVIDGITYEPEAGQFTDTEKSREIESSDSEMDGILISSQITYNDIRLGLYDRATIEIFQIDWTDTSSDRVVFFTGYFSQSTVQGGKNGAQRIKMTFRSWDGLAEQNWTVKVAIRCGLEFGGSICGVNLTPLTDTLEITAVTDEATFEVDNLNSRTSGYWDRGFVVFTSGAIASSRKWIISSNNGSTINLAQKLPFLPQIGDTLTATTGCDKLLNSDNGCKRYNNQANFAKTLAGAAYVPGSDTFGGA